MSDAINLIDNEDISYIFLFKGEEASVNAQKIMEEYPEVKTIELHKLDNITDEERSEKEDYISLMKNNLELIKKELYQ